MVEEEIPLDFDGFGAVRCSAEDEMAVEADFGAGGGGLAAVVALDAGSPDDDIGVFCEGVADEEFIVAGFVSADSETGAVVAFDPERGSGERGGEAVDAFEGGWEMAERRAGEIGDFVAEFSDPRRPFVGHHRFRVERYQKKRREDRGSFGPPV